MSRICIVTGAHLCRNPRVVKEADVLTLAGHDITVLGPILSEELEAVDCDLLNERAWRRVPTVDLRTSRGTVDRIRRRLGIEAVERLGVESPHALGYGMRTAFRMARALRPDLVIGHQEVGLWVASRMRRLGFRAGVDLEDWYSQDLLPEARRGRPVGLLADLESEMIHTGAPVFTTSDVMGEAMAAATDGPYPTTIYNAFPWADRQAIDGESRDRPDRSRPSLHWVSQTIGKGRGLDLLFSALRDVSSPIDVHLRGATDAEANEWLRKSFPSEFGHRLFVHLLVPPSELLSRLAEHDIGVALEESSPPSRDLTITNKILHYLLGGLAVIATSTRGQVEVAAKASGAVHLLDEQSPSSLAGELNCFIEDRSALETAKGAALEAAEKVFCWERQEPKLVGAVEHALNQRSR